MIILSILVILLIILISLVSIILFSEISVIMSTEGKNVNLRFKILGIRISVPLDKKKSRKAETEEKNDENEGTVMKKFLDMRNNFSRSKKAIELVIIYLRKRIKISELGVMGEFGTGNAASTGIAYGAVNGFVNTVFGFLGQYFSIKKAPSVAVKLNYNKAVFNLKFAFMIKTKIWYLLKALLIYRNNIK